MEEYTWQTWLKERVQDDRLFERMLQEIHFDRVYARGYSHGTDGHLARTIISHFADLLDELDALGLLDRLNQHTLNEAFKKANPGS